MAFPLGWQRVCPITIPRGLVRASCLSNFPVLIPASRLPAEMVTLGGANAAQSDGGDIRFSLDAAGLVQLPCEIAKWAQHATPASATAKIWVSVPALYGDSDNTIYVWYQPTATQTQPASNSAYGSQAVWDSSYKFVWHAGDGSALNLADSTSNANDLTNTGTVSAVAGPTNLLGAANFTSSNGVLSRLASVAGLSTAAPITTEAWVNWRDDASARYAVSATRTSTQPTAYGGIEILGTGVDDGKVDQFLGSTVYKSTSALTLNSWAHVAQVTAGQLLAQYINGATDRSQSTVAYTPNALGIVIGGWADAGGSYSAAGVSWLGYIAEVRISNTSRSTGWLATQYANETNPTTFLIPGTPYAPGAYASPGGFYGTRF